jgi:hypothetical protein
MSPRTQPPAPLTDASSYWRRLKAAVHPDRDAGDHELYVFLTALEEHVARCQRSCGGNSALAFTNAGEAYYSSAERSGSARVPYDEQLGYADEHVTLTLRAISVAQRVEEPYREVLMLLIDCPSYEHGRAAMQQMRGASYKQLGYMGRLVGMNEAQRSRLYELARTIPLSQTHAHHIIERLVEERRAA